MDKSIFIYLETQGSLCGKEWKTAVVNSCHPHKAQLWYKELPSTVLGVSMNKIEVDVTRLGGGFW